MKRKSRGSTTSPTPSSSNGGAGGANPNQEATIAKLIKTLGMTREAVVAMLGTGEARAVFLSSSLLSHSLSLSLSLTHTHSSSSFLLLFLPPPPLLLILRQLVETLLLHQLTMEQALLLL
jgi:hypothetical protein